MRKMNKVDRELVKERAFWTCMGIWEGTGIIALVYIVVCAGWDFTRNHTGWGKDDSDAPNEFSNMDVRTDALTGCQYLAASSLTPRMGADGRQICGLRK